MTWQLTRPPADDQTIAQDDDPTLAMPTGPSIAVLPFDNLSGDPEQDYFVDGITEEIIAELTRFPELFVLARIPFQFKGQAIFRAGNGQRRSFSTRFLLWKVYRRTSSALVIGEKCDTTSVQDSGSCQLDFPWSLPSLRKSRNTGTQSAAKFGRAGVCNPYF